MSVRAIGVSLGRGVFACGLCALFSCSTQSNGSELHSRTSQAIDDDSAVSIDNKWAELGGKAALGIATSDVMSGPNGTQVRLYQKGVLVHSDTWGTVLFTQSTFDFWSALADRKSITGENLQSYLGLPRSNAVIDDTQETVVFERGAIVFRPALGEYWVIESEFWARYASKAKSLGLPTSDAQAVTHGARQTFENGDIYWNTQTGRSAIVKGAIRDRWLALGGSSGQLAFPIVDEGDIPGSQPPARVGQFEKGAIYSYVLNGQAVTVELHGQLYTAYLNKYGGPRGWLGLPIAEEHSTPTSGGIFADFQNGVIVHHDTGENQGTYAFDQLTVSITRVEGHGEDGFLGLAGPLDVAAHFSATTSAGQSMSERRPESGTGGQDFEITDLNWNITKPVRGDLVINVRASASDKDSLLNAGDEDLGSVSVDYTIDNLWGLFAQRKYSSSNHDHGVSFDVWITVKNTYAYDKTNFLAQEYWSFHNFDTAHLSYDQYAETFKDVSPDEKWLFHPLNALYYRLLYEGIAKEGACYGMSLESVNANHGRSMYSEPIAQYFPDNDSANLLLNDAAHKDLANELNVKHGYQLGDRALLHGLNAYLAGDMHNPVRVFQQSRDAYLAGDTPVISLSKSLFKNTGHTVRPYEWDDSNSKEWKILVADPNCPADDDTCPLTAAGQSASEIRINPQDNSFKMYVNNAYWKYSGGTSGAMMYYVPYHVISEQPSTPMDMVWSLLNGTVFFILSGDGETHQVMDDDGHTFLEPDLTSSPTGWDQITEDATKRIPDLVPVPLAAGDGDSTEMYIARGKAGTYRYQVGLRDGAPKGSSYDWFFNSAIATSLITVPGTAGVPDILSAENVGTRERAVSITVPANGESKDVEWTIAGAAKRRWTQLTQLRVNPAQSIAIRVKDGDNRLQIDNYGPVTSAKAQVVTDSPTADTLDAGTLNIPTGTSCFDQRDPPMMIPCNARREPVADAGVDAGTASSGGRTSISGDTQVTLASGGTPTSTSGAAMHMGGAAVVAMGGMSTVSGASGGTPSLATGGTFFGDGDAATANTSGSVSARSNSSTATSGSSMPTDAGVLSGSIGTDASGCHCRVAGGGSGVRPRAGDLHRVIAGLMLVACVLARRRSGGPFSHRGRIR